VSTALFSMLMGAYYTAFTDILMLEEYAHNQRAFASVGPSILDLIEDDVLSMHTHPRELAAFPMRGSDDSLESEPADTLQFVSRRASVAQEEFFGRGAWVRSPINEIGYRMGRGSYQLGNVRRLFRRESYYVDETPLQGGDYYEVYDRIVSFDIAYAGYRAEEEAREDAESLDERNLDRFESWDSEERKGLPSAIIVTIVIEPPQLTNEVRDESEQVEGRDRRTFVRIIPLTQADDVDAPPAGNEQPGQTPGQTPGQNPGQTPGQTPGR
jgi:hypothetical protein